MKLVRSLSALLLAIALLLIGDTAAAQFVFRLEGGNVAKKDTYNDPTWDLVNLKYTYDNPIVIAIPDSNGSHPADFRIKNVLPGSFEVTLSEPPSEDGPHVAMNVAYIAVDASDALQEGRTRGAGSSRWVEQPGGAEGLCARLNGRAPARCSPHAEARRARDDRGGSARCSPNGRDPVGAALRETVALRETGALRRPAALRAAGGRFEATNGRPRSAADRARQGAHGSAARAGVNWLTIAAVLVTAIDGRLGPWAAFL